MRSRFRYVRICHAAIEIIVSVPLAVEDRFVFMGLQTSEDQCCEQPDQINGPKQDQGLLLPYRLAIHCRL